MVVIAAALLLKRKKRRAAELRLRLAKIQLAIRITQHKTMHLLIGSGHVAYGLARRGYALLKDASKFEVMQHQIMHAPHKLFSDIHVTDKEFFYFAKYYERLRQLSGGSTPGTRFRRNSYGQLWPEWYMLFDYISNDKDLREMESCYQKSFSSVRRTLYNSMQLYVALLERMLSLNRWPSVLEQDALIEMLPPALKHLRFFFLVDSFKVSNVDSTDINVRRQHFQIPK